MIAGAIILTLIGVIGIYNFFTGKRKHVSRRWWEYALLIISLLFVAQGVLAIMWPEALRCIYG